MSQVLAIGLAVVLSAALMLQGAAPVEAAEAKASKAISSGTTKSRPTTQPNALLGIFVQPATSNKRRAMRSNRRRSLLSG
jgi:hypothetical protein